MNNLPTPIPIYWQHNCQFDAQKRGFNLITESIKSAIQTMPSITTGLMHLFLKHTSASLAISENASFEVALDLEEQLSRLFPDDLSRYRHVDEGPDDMPAHLKNITVGSELTIPIMNGQLALGQWQGIFLCEFRNNAPKRQIIITSHGICV